MLAGSNGDDDTGSYECPPESASDALSLLEEANIDSIDVEQ